MICILNIYLILNADSNNILITEDTSQEPSSIFLNNLDEYCYYESREQLWGKRE
jgi:hypothetical protein